MVQALTAALIFLIEVSGLCTCSPSSGFLWNETGENWKRFIYLLIIIPGEGQARIETNLFIYFYSYILKYIRVSVQAPDHATMLPIKVYNKLHNIAAVS